VIVYVITSPCSTFTASLECVFFAVVLSASNSNAGGVAIFGTLFDNADALYFTVPSAALISVIYFLIAKSNSGFSKFFVSIEALSVFVSFLVILHLCYNFVT